MSSRKPKIPPSREKKQGKISEETPANSPGAANRSLGLNRRFSAISGSVASPSGSGRLPSLKPARDLTLGGSQKRTFTPTIPSRVRVKEEPTDGATDSARKHKPNVDKKRDHKKTPGRGRGRGRGDIIQADSVFSMGPAERSKVVRSNSGGGGGIFSGDTVKSSIKKEKSDFDENDSAAVIKMLQYEDDLQDVDQTSGMIPVQLPLYQSDELKDMKPDIKTEINVKTEPMYVDEKDSGVKLKKPLSSADVKAKDEQSQQSCGEFITKTLKEKEEQLVFIQLPDVLPLRKPSSDTTDDAMDTATSDNKSEECKKEVPTLADIPEGYIGKLQVTKSGKARLVLGDIVLNVSLGTPCGFLQDVAALRIDDDQNVITKLGHVDHRFICTPDFEQLLQS